PLIRFPYTTLFRSIFSVVSLKVSFDPIKTPAASAKPIQRGKRGNLFLGVFFGVEDCCSIILIPNLKCVVCLRPLFPKRRCRSCLYIRCNKTFFLFSSGV